jgi:para-nitrobenzyl esterase
MGVAPKNATGWASHASDVVFTFDTGRGGACHFDAADELLSRQVMHFWATFAATGEPSKVKWPQFEAVGAGVGNISNTMQLGTAIELLHDYRAEDCSFWDGLRPSPQRV